MQASPRRLQSAVMHLSSIETLTLPCSMHALLQTCSAELELQNCVAEESWQKANPDVTQAPA